MSKLLYHGVIPRITNKTKPLGEKFWNTEQTAYCPVGYNGNSVTIPPGEYYSYTSLEAANSKALAAAQSLLVCQPNVPDPQPISPPFQLTVSTVEVDNFLMKGFEDYFRNSEYKNGHIYSGFAYFPPLDDVIEEYETVHGGEYNKNGPPRFFLKEKFTGIYSVGGSEPGVEPGSIGWGMYITKWEGERVWEEFDNSHLETYFGGSYDSYFVADENTPGLNGIDSNPETNDNGGFYHGTRQIPDFTPGQFAIRLTNVNALNPKPPGEEGIGAEALRLPTLHRVTGLEIVTDQEAFAGGFRQRELLDEYTPCDGLDDAIIDQNPPKQESTYNDEQARNSVQVSSDVVWIGDEYNPRLFSGTRQSWEITISDLTPGKGYKIIWNVSGVENSHIFYPTESTYIYEQVASCKENEIHSNWDVVSL